ncbi:GNAT family N-acetyltransferase [Magnetovibrio sp. PR-2]|uniref:GNAT family N-acetyltransferase n=1 Tax=Magnetovibrio sp. PR-2 TaxID=3120356 RepID=UPI002FCE3777
MTIHTMDLWLAPTSQTRIIAAMIHIREATAQDWPGIWDIFSAVVKRGDTYAYAPDTSEEDAKQIWMAAPKATYVAVDGDDVVGTYYIKTNQVGQGSHVCNAGFMVHEDQRGRGLGRSLGVHALDQARALGYRAMQFNFVVARNTSAIKLWESLGFETIGRLPQAFKGRDGFQDVLVMYQVLGEAS